MSGRNVDADSAKLLAIQPVWTGETLRKLYADLKAMTRGTGFGGVTGTASSYPDQMNELNWHCLWVPWRIWVTFHNTNRYDDIDSPDSADDMDRLWRNLLFEWESGGSEYYGGDADVDKIEYNKDDDEENTTSDGSTGAQDATAEKASVAEMGSLGPLGVIRLFGREVWASNMVSDGDGKVRQGDELTVEVPVSIPGPGMVCLGMVRYEHAAETNFNVEINTSSRRQAHNMLVGGDLSRVQGHIEKDSGTVGDWIRTVLFGGDMYAEADTVKGESLKAYAKGVVTVETPYKLQRF